MERHIIKNFAYQAIFQITKILIPFITIPIVSKALGPEGIGLFNYTNSIVQYFILLTSLGLATYSNREIAIAVGKRRDISKLFWELFFLKIIIGVTVLISYFVFINFLPYKNLYIFQVPFLLGAIVDISWFFMGIEDFKKTSIINLLVQLFTFCAIILFVKDSTDLNVYILIQSLGAFFSQILVWIFLKNHIIFTFVSIKGIFSHLRGSIDFFILQISIMLYTNLNKTIIGYFYAPTFVAYYTNGMQLTTIVVTVITTLDTVLLPHMSKLFAQNNLKKILILMDKTIHLQLFFSIPMMFGILIIYDKFIPWFFGDKFSYLSNVIPVFSVLVVIIPLGIAIARQYLTPLGEIKKFNKSVIIGALVNISFIFILTPFFNFMGVVYAIVVAEFFVTLTRLVSFLKNTNFKFNSKKIIIFTSSSVIMCLATRYITKNFSSNIFTNLIQVFIGTLIYMVITFIFKNNELYNLFIKKRNNMGENE